MRTLFFVLLLAAPAGLIAQTGGTFHITGKITGFHGHSPWVWLIYSKNGERMLDSTKVVDNSYSFTGTLTDNSLGAISDTTIVGGALYWGHGVQLYLMPESFTITHVDSFSNIVTTGSKVNADLVGFSKAFKLYDPQFHAIYALEKEAKKSGDTALAAIADKREDSLAAVVSDSVYGNYVRKQPLSPLALYALQYYAGAEPDTKAIRALYATLGEPARNSKDGKAFLEKLDALDNMSVGKEAADFTQKDTAGIPVTLSSYRGKYVLLDFWASWCAPCRAENPNVVKAYGKYHPKGFEILSVSLDKEADKDKWLKAIHDDKLTWTHVSDLQSWGNSVAKTYAIQAIPQNFLIDPAGKIVGKNLRGEELAKKLKEVYGE